MARICIVIPTLNEAGTIAELCRSILDTVPDSAIIVIDDNSTDGTIEALNDIANEGAPVQVVVRSERQGIGSAHKLGLELASSQGFEVAVTMDADLSHSPKDIPRLIGLLSVSEVAIGSRFLPGGGVEGWPLHRKFLTYLGHLLTVVFLRVNLDSSTAFRAYRLSPELIRILKLAPSNSYGFFVESISLINTFKLQVSQTPVVLPSRTYGNSKMRLVDLIDTVRRLVKVRKLAKSDMRI